MVRLSRTLAALTLAGCYQAANNPTPPDDDTWRWFSLDGDRTWTYESTDPTTPYRLIAHKPVDTELDEATGRQVHTITFTYDCLSNSGDCTDADADGAFDIEGQTAWIWRMSVTSGGGAVFHSFEDDDQQFALDPPVTVAGASQALDEVVTSESGGVSYTSTYALKGLCDAPYWGELMPDFCIDFVLDDGGAGTPIAGTYQALSGYGVVSFTLAEDGRLWRLRDYEESDR
jgi:hypothetical protein